MIDRFNSDEDVDFSTMLCCEDCVYYTRDDGGTAYCGQGNSTISKAENCLDFEEI